MGRRKNSNNDCYNDLVEYAKKKDIYIYNIQIRSLEEGGITSKTK